MPRRAVGPTASAAMKVTPKATWPRRLAAETTRTQAGVT
jgi:hypothetical protein